MQDAVDGQETDVGLNPAPGARDVLRAAASLDSGAVVAVQIPLELDSHACHTPPDRVWANPAGAAHPRVASDGDSWSLTRMRSRTDPNPIAIRRWVAAAQSQSRRPKSTSR